jgi:CRISPR-associated protein Cas2
MAYDVNVKRVNKILKIARKYLTWVQNSLLEGEITEAKFTKLKLEVQKKAKREEDSVCWYVMKEKKWIKKENYGIEKGEPSFLVE